MLEFQAQRLVVMIHNQLYKHTYNSHYSSSTHIGYTIQFHRYIIKSTKCKYNATNNYTMYVVPITSQCHMWATAVFVMPNKGNDYFLVSILNNINLRKICNACDTTHAMTYYATTK